MSGLKGRHTSCRGLVTATGPFRVSAQGTCPRYTILSQVSQNPDRSRAF